MVNNMLELKSPKIFSEETMPNFSSIALKPLLETDQGIDQAASFINSTYSESELFIGLVGPVGTDLAMVENIIAGRLKNHNYKTNLIRISQDIINEIGEVNEHQNDYERIQAYMEEGNRLREISGDNSILSHAVAAKINEERKKRSEKDQLEPLKKNAFIINSLKHPEEVERLRQVYSEGFYLIGVHTSEERRSEYLSNNKGMKLEQAQELIKRDGSEEVGHGQHTRDTYHLSDFFIHYDGNHDKFQNDIWRALDLAFGKPHITPTFDEFAMFMAFSASLRSADLSRQVGAVLSHNKNIISTGANDVPRSGGGLYWPEYDEKASAIVDHPDGRDYKRGFDSNAAEKSKIIKDIVENAPQESKEYLEEYLKSSKIKDITEYGRVVHAEMEAILACSRNGISTKETDLYCTTFPCHNCAKHIIASGIKRVVYVEPYPKSKANEFHADSIETNNKTSEKVTFEPFVGVGPRSFFNLFSTTLGSGNPVKRKEKDGKTKSWSPDKSRLRMQLLPCSYIERESISTTMLANHLEKISE